MSAERPAERSRGLGPNARSLAARLRGLVPSPRRALRLFVISNIAFLGVDIVIAHLANDFERRAEWAPVIFSAVATVLLLPGIFGSQRAFVRPLERAVAVGAIVVGVLGMCFHLESGFFEQATLHQLVYSAPFVAPLSYVGVGLLLLLVHSEDATTPSFGPWILLLALGGFGGNLGLSLLDHAQNGFYHVTEWIPVAAAAYGVGFLVLAVARAPALDGTLLRACVGVMLVQMVVGVAGAALHVDANLTRSAMSTFRDRFVFGAPAFAPLLFPNLALLALIGLWASVRAPAAATGGEVPEAPGAVSPPSRPDAA